MSAAVAYQRVSASAPSGLRPVAEEKTRALFQQHHRRVFAFCLDQLRDHEDAEDATQLTFIYAFRSLQRGVRPEFETAWLFKIALNCCRSSRRDRGRRGASVDYDVNEIPDAAGENASELKERLLSLREALAGLSENQRRTILLREWQGLSYADIADKLGLSVAAVETLLFRARKSLVKRLAEPPAIARGLGDGSSSIEWSCATNAQGGPLSSKV